MIDKSNENLAFYVLLTKENCLFFLTCCLIFRFSHASLLAGNLTGKEKGPGNNKNRPYDRKDKNKGIKALFQHVSKKIAGTQPKNGRDYGSKPVI